MKNKITNNKLFQSNVQSVNKDWIDYNGHMNVAYYTLAFDKALDDFLEDILKIGPTFVKKEKQGPYSLQANYHYLNELKINDFFFSRIYLVDYDKKKIHLVLEMIDNKSGKQVAVCETLLINVDLNLRKSVEYGASTIKRIKDYFDICIKLKIPIQIGKNIQIIKK